MAGVITRALEAFERWNDVRAYATEQRDSNTQREAVSAYILARAQGLAPVVAGGAIAAQEVAAGFLARAFVDAIIEGDGGLITRSVRILMGRALVERGEFLFFMVGGRLIQSPAWEVYGGVDPQSWTVRRGSGWTYHDLSQAVYDVEMVLHAVSEPDPDAPWRGVVPIRRQGVTADLAGLMEASLRMEAHRADQADHPDAGRRRRAHRDRRSKRPSRTPRRGSPRHRRRRRAYGDGRAAAPAKDYAPQNLGPEPTVTAVTAGARCAGTCPLAGLGLHPSLMNPDATAGALREAHRQAQIDFVEPLGKIVSEAVSEWMQRPVRMYWPLRTDTMLVQARVIGRAGEERDRRARCRADGRRRGPVPRDAATPATPRRRPRRRTECRSRLGSSGTAVGRPSGTIVVKGVSDLKLQLQREHAESAADFERSLGLAARRALHVTKGHTPRVTGDARGFLDAHETHALGVGVALDGAAGKDALARRAVSSAPAWRVRSRRRHGKTGVRRAPG